MKIKLYEECPHRRGWEALKDTWGELVASSWFKKWEKERASCRHSKYLLNCIQRKMAWIWRDLKTTPPPNMPLWHDYFELEANENQQMQKEPFLDLPFPDYTQKFLRNEDCHKSPLLSSFIHTQEEDRKTIKLGLQTSIIKIAFQFLVFPSHFPTICHSSPNPFFLYSTSVCATDHSLLKRYVSSQAHLFWGSFF